MNRDNNFTLIVGALMLLAMLMVSRKHAPSATDRSPKEST